MAKLFLRLKLNEKEQELLRHLPKDTALIIEKLILNNREIQQKNDVIDNLKEEIKNLKHKITLLNPQPKNEQ